MSPHLKKQPCQKTILYEKLLSTSIRISFYETL